MKLETTVLGLPVTAELTKLDEGWDVSVFGGCRTHVGAVTMAAPDGTAETVERPGHKDSAVSVRWAAELAALLKAPVCVRCGIHYDNAAAEQIQTILAACEALLHTAVGSLLAPAPSSVPL